MNSQYLSAGLRTNFVGCRRAGPRSPARAPRTSLTWIRAARNNPDPAPQLAYKQASRLAVIAVRARPASKLLCPLTTAAQVSRPATGWPGVSAFPLQAAAPPRQLQPAAPGVPRASRFRRPTAHRMVSRGALAVALATRGTRARGPIRQRAGAPVQAFRVPIPATHHHQQARRREIRAAAMGGGSATPCYYAVLGVPRNASAGDITAAYRRKVQILHPLLRGEDSPLTKQAEAMFHQLREAYEVLSDASQRAAYDANVCQAEPDDPARASLSNDPVIEEMRSRLARMREFLSSKQVATDASVQQPKLTREEMQERKKEMNKGFVTLLCPSSMSSRSGAEPSGSGPRTAVWISGGGKQSIHFIARANANPRCILLRRSPTNSTDKAGSWC